MYEGSTRCDGKSGESPGSTVGMDPRFVVHARGRKGKAVLVRTEQPPNFKDALEGLCVKVRGEVGRAHTADCPHYRYPLLRKGTALGACCGSVWEWDGLLDDRTDQTERSLTEDSKGQRTKAIRWGMPHVPCATPRRRKCPKITVRQETKRKCLLVARVTLDIQVNALMRQHMGTMRGKLANDVPGLADSSMVMCAWAAAGAYYPDRPCSAHPPPHSASDNADSQGPTH
jgi:hypothetical protein